MHKSLPHWPNSSPDASAGSLFLHALVFALLGQKVREPSLEIKRYQILTSTANLGVMSPSARLLCVLHVRRTVFGALMVAYTT